MYEFTSFNEGISKTDNGTDDDIILALSSPSLAWCDLNMLLCASYSPCGLKKKIPKECRFTSLLQQQKNYQLFAMNVPWRIRATSLLISFAFLSIIVDFSSGKFLSSIWFPQDSSLCLQRQTGRKMLFISNINLK